MLTTWTVDTDEGHRRTYAETTIRTKGEFEEGDHLAHFGVLLPGLWRVEKVTHVGRDGWLFLDLVLVDRRDHQPGQRH